MEQSQNSVSLSWFSFKDVMDMMLKNMIKFSSVMAVLLCMLLSSVESQGQTKFLELFTNVPVSGVPWFNCTLRRLSDGSVKSVFGPVSMPDRKLIVSFSNTEAWGGTYRLEGTISGLLSGGVLTNVNETITIPEGSSTSYGFTWGHGYACYRFPLVAPTASVDGGECGVSVSLAIGTLGISHKWQASINGVMFQDIPGATGISASVNRTTLETLFATNIMGNPVYFRCQVTDC
jgi:hypothetical protein